MRLSGPVHPGANHIVFETGDRKVFLKYGDRNLVREWTLSLPLAASCVSCRLPSLLSISYFLWTIFVRCSSPVDIGSLPASYAWVTWWSGISLTATLSSSIANRAFTSRASCVTRWVATTQASIWKHTRALGVHSTELIPPRPLSITRLRSRCGPGEHSGSTSASVRHTTRTLTETR